MPTLLALTATYPSLFISDSFYLSVALDSSLKNETTTVATRNSLYIIEARHAEGLHDIDCKLTTTTTFRERYPAHQHPFRHKALRSLDCAECPRLTTMSTQETFDYLESLSGITEVPGLALVVEQPVGALLDYKGELVTRRELFGHLNKKTGNRSLHDEVTEIKEVAPDSMISPDLSRLLREELGLKF